MQRLILMRHGDAERPAPGLEDFERGLTAEGRAESRLVGQALAEAGLAPDLGLVSSARRAAETWRAAAEAFPQALCEQDRALYAASAVRLAAAVRTVGDRAQALMVVSHNPGLHQLAIRLSVDAGASQLSTRPLFERFPTGSAVVFRFDPAGRPTFERLFLVKDLRRAKP